MKATLLLVCFAAYTFLVSGSFSCRCIFNSGTTQSQMQAAIDYVCGHMDCSPISMNGSFFYPNTLPEHASWAIQAWWGYQSGVPEACNFSNSAMVECEDCVCSLKNTTTPAQMQTTLDYVCKNLDCSAIQPGGSQYLPDTLVHHAQFAIDIWWQEHGWSLNACSFSGIGYLTPSNCLNYSDYLYRQRISDN
eukprot:TRINITY_DN10912_c0_g1_i1.p1 TRINITY_DN10912_c0_g1~~TRINITY_DN10912_c0_g1_i1.p1  ORF type:complete len:191 (-),score=24.62 TRINITY_DN10912_c0_g1_i1:14-586(-)